MKLWNDQIADRAEPIYHPLIFFSFLFFFFFFFVCVCVCVYECMRGWGGEGEIDMH